jgi:hypothetical protein
MSKNQVKLVIWLALVVVALLAVYGAVSALGELVTHFNTGADPRSALNLLPTAPPDLDKRLRWQESSWSGRPLETFTRDKIANAYLRAWAQWNISYEVGQPYGLTTYFSGPALAGVSAAVEETARNGWQARQSDLRHNLELTFYADDGLAVAFTDHQVPVVQALENPETGETMVVETRATYDVVMLIEDGNWRLRYWQRRPDDSLPITRQATGSEPLFAAVSGDQLGLNGQPFLVAGINYYPQATPWTEFWPNYDADIVRKDLEIIRSLGLNAVTIFVPFEQFGADEPDEWYLARLSDFLDEADRQQIQVIVTLFDHRTDHDPANWSADDRHIAALVGQFASHPAILAWNLKNEPDRDYEANSPELVNAWLRHVAAEVRRYDPHHLVTIGWSTPAAAQALVDVVDFVSYHYYAPAANYPRQLAELQAAAGGKPLLLQEFGLPTWNTIWPNGHTEAEQAVYYADILAVQRLSNTAGYMAWTLYDFEAVPLAEFRFPWQRGPQANMGVIRLDNSPKPAAFLLAPQADLSIVPDLPPWHRFNKPFWRMVLVFVAGLVGLGLLMWLGRAFSHYYGKRLARHLNASKKPGEQRTPDQAGLDASSADVVLPEP